MGPAAVLPMIWLPGILRSRRHRPRRSQPARKRTDRHRSSGRRAAHLCSGVLAGSAPAPGRDRMADMEARDRGARFARDKHAYAFFWKRRRKSSRTRRWRSTWIDDRTKTSFMGGDRDARGNSFNSPRRWRTILPILIRSSWPMLQEMCGRPAAASQSIEPYRWRTGIISLRRSASQRAFMSVNPSKAD